MKKQDSAIKPKKYEEIDGVLVSEKDLQRMKKKKKAEEEKQLLDETNEAEYDYFVNMIEKVIGNGEERKQDEVKSSMSSEMTR